MHIFSCQEFIEIMDSDAIRLIDVRSDAEFRMGHIAGAELLPQPFIELVAGERLQDKGATIVLCCAAGGRATMAAHSLEAMGYTNVSVLEGGYGAWCELQS